MEREGDRREGTERERNWRFERGRGVGRGREKGVRGMGRGRKVGKGNKTEGWGKKG